MRLDTNQTCIVVSCYRGDIDLVKQNLPMWRHHDLPLVLFSPKNSSVDIPGVPSQSHGRAAYIGDDSLQRHLHYLRAMLEIGTEFFLMTDPDAFCLSPELPARLYQEDCVWTNEVIEPRPHESPYPKIAMQPPFFMRYSHIERMVKIAHKIVAHPITPYIDWFQLALVREAGIAHRPFTDLEHPSTAVAFEGTNPWEQLRYRIQHMGAIFMHPIKTQWQLELCQKAYESRDTNSR